MLPLVYHPIYSIPWPARHRFPMAKYRLLQQRLSDLGILTTSNGLCPERPTIDLISQAHCPKYVADFVHGRLAPQAEKSVGLPWSEQLVERTLTAVAGTLLTCETALKQGLACHLAGGTHHAHYDHGEGFCVFNDLAVAARTLISRGDARRILILDCDVHQGDGTARILSNDAQVFTCSIHAKNNYPFDKAQSDLDVELPCGLDDAGYLQALNCTLERLDAPPKPDLLIYDAGCDVHLDDRLGRLCLTDDGIRTRDRRVLDWARQRGIPTACVIGGGYDHDVQQLVHRHSLLAIEAHALYAHWTSSTKPRRVWEGS